MSEKIDLTPLDMRAVHALVMKEARAALRASNGTKTLGEMIREAQKKVARELGLEMTGPELGSWLAQQRGRLLRKAPAPRASRKGRAGSDGVLKVGFGTLELDDRPPQGNESPRQKWAALSKALAGLKIPVGELYSQRLVVTLEAKEDINRARTTIRRVARELHWPRVILEGNPANELQLYVWKAK